jgi:hypothetical protein
MSSRRGGRSAVLMLASGCGVTPPVSSDALAGPSAFVRIASSRSSPIPCLLTARPGDGQKEKAPWSRGSTKPSSLGLRSGNQPPRRRPAGLSITSSPPPFHHTRENERVSGLRW